MKKIYILILIILVLFAGGVFIYWKKHSTKSVPETSTTPPTVSSAPAPTQPTINTSIFAYPIADFTNRITKKPFGIYITPATSPVQPERFTGYHTGTDIEYQDVGGDVPVYAISDGTIVLSKTASGYGGVFLLEIAGNHTILYGHIRPSSLPKVGTQVKKGDQLAVLGTGYSSEADGERRHLHFAVLSTNRLDIKGYVQNKSQLSGWIDPVSLYK